MIWLLFFVVVFFFFSTDVCQWIIDNNKRKRLTNEIQVFFYPRFVSWYSSINIRFFIITKFERNIEWVHHYHFDKLNHRILDFRHRFVENYQLLAKCDGITILHFISLISRRHKSQIKVKIFRLYISRVLWISYCLEDALYV
jgi:hypothetical protein